MNQPVAARVIAYIDGFNLYHGLRDAGWRSLYWLDMPTLASNLLKPQQTLVLTKYFTARIAGPKAADSPAKSRRLADKRRRQTAYLDALATLNDLEIYEGHYLAKDRSCRNCGANWTSHEEKMTDVNIATEMLTDVFHNAFDVALLVSA
ncbi:MAG: NYN domain-containing protein, partial [Rhodospirillales bacterium]|nr:NYN domain-containing protein [Rhodospirillales bacterium]